MRFKIRIVIYFIVLAFVLLTMYFLYNNFRYTPRDYNEICADSALRIVTEYNQSGYYVSGDTIAGFQYELCNEITRLSGLDVQLFLEMSLYESFKGLKNQKYDIIAGTIPINSDIREEFLFTDPIVLNKQILVQRSVNKNDSVKLIRNQLELGSKTLHIPKNSPAMLRIVNLQHEIGDTIYVVEDEKYSSEQLIIMVARGDIDYAVCDQRIAEIAKSRFPEIDIKTDISFTQLQSWAVRKESTILLDSLNSWFGTIRDAGLYDRIYKRYYKNTR